MLWTLAAVATLSFAQTTGSISGTVKDPSGAVIAGATVTATNAATNAQSKSVTDDKGFYAFPSLPVGRYTVRASEEGFGPQTRTLQVDSNSAIVEDLTMAMAEKVEEVTVLENATQVETASSQMGQVVTGTQMTDVALNGRSYTDLLALQPGIVPMSTQQPDSIVMAGASVAIAPSGDLNPGNQSISGQREDANGFMVNGGDVKELMNGGTTIVPDLDSIAEFRVLTNNVNAEYGNYSGGIVNVVTKGGGNQIHGSAFEFLRNTDLDARNFFSPERSFYRQNQYGGTVGGPIRKDKIFYFADYQGTRTAQGIDTGLIPVPTLAERAGNFSAIPGAFSGEVGGPYLASLLSQKLGYNVTANEPYSQVFPNGIIPLNVWSAPAQHLLQYVPLPNVGPSAFSTSSEGETVRDDKGSFKLDANSQRFGLLSAYYFFDDWTLNNPYPTGQGGASVPGFNALTLGRAQLVNLGDTKTFGPSTVNELRLSFMRDSNNVGQPAGGVGPSLQSQGFAPPPEGIVPLAPSIEGVENTIFNSFVIGTPITNLKQANNTYALNDNVSRVWGAHTVKAGFEFSYEQVNVNPNPTFNGSFLFSGSETGTDFADFLLGVASNYNQADSQSYYIRHRYYGAFVQDSWRARNNLTLNYGVRWDRMEYWSEKYNQIPTFLPGEQSAVFPTAPPGIVYVGDEGVPNTLVPSSNRFSPRLGIAYSPAFKDGWIAKLTGGPDKTSIRAGYGIYYSVIEGNTMAIDEPQPPYGLSYTSPGPPLFATPFVTASNGAFNGNPFPLRFPPLNTSIKNPNSSFDFSVFEPIAGMTAPPPWNTYPYNENYFLSIERQLGGDTVLSLAYVGSQAHHLLLVYSANPGNPALCLALSRPSAVAPGSPTCGPFGEDTTYTTASGQVLQGTRAGLGPAFSNDDYDASVANSNYNSFELTLRHSTKNLTFLVGYTYSKSIDQASSISDPGNPFNLSATRALSSWDLTHNFVASYQYTLPFEHFFGHVKYLTDGWQISGITRISTGFPVTLHADGDNSLMGSIPNGVNNHSLDLPDYNGAPLDFNHDPRNGRPYFNPAAFSENALGTPGTASRRSFYGPGMVNFDLALLKSFQFDEARALQFRLEAFNAFNHAQFFGPAAVNGDINSTLFGRVVNAAPPRLMQAALKFTF
ncbi:MAG TPA: TonB-dependent receptor [Bryobacteraceae bacterium]|nr:TonB-dependent receptor [Bryobacteraceae bacterium]